MTLVGFIVIAFIFSFIKPSIPPQLSQISPEVTSPSVNAPMVQAQREEREILSEEKREEKRLNEEKPPSKEKPPSQSEPKAVKKIEKKELSKPRAKEEVKVKAKKEKQRSLDTKSFASKESVQRKDYTMIDRAQLDQATADEKVQTKEPSLLRHSNLLNNLLLNAEEARRNKNYDEAIYYYETYLRYRLDPDVLNNLGGIYFQKGEYLKAKHYFERAYKIRQEEIYLLNIIKSQIALGERESACKELMKRDFSSALTEEVIKLKRFCNSQNSSR